MDSKSTSFEVSAEGGTTFSGRSQDLPAFLMHVRLKELLDSDLREQAIKCAYVALQLRSRAQDWFSSHGTGPSGPSKTAQSSGLGWSTTGC
ncbi:hypothetical protein K470DRAFT_258824 [Piedraia hortae CBS 480.64]|uniref:Uncharacterized protein n=1 Tax=Piedraia hortae CBS 480.64 TaxID=1314780 RepID=A0A6A7BWN4_9PEZI|nr:hypothetical protein K470DRAFT_258824 [Piedraia hortae CBS 480.64]